MRLNPFDTSKIDVRGGGGGGGRGKLGLGAIVIALIGSVLFGTDFMSTLGIVQGATQQTGSVSSDDGLTEQEFCTQNDYAQEGCAALTSLNETWGQVFQQQGAQGFQPPFLLYYSGQVNSGCGAASSQAGPFYCPSDGGIYIDTGFFDVLDDQLGASGDFARLYVMAHEYGHHIQNVTGIAGQIRSAQGANPRSANQLSVRLELQADCYAGVWAAKNRDQIEPGDIEEGLRAASAIGDDRLTGGSVAKENFTHGTSAQRSQALQLGLQGDDRQCTRITQIG